ncbi:MAG: extracellular solute-binding protein [Clostridia bacterium]|nr:extracellular solute-binding protein [Clostridia bacterium]
MKNKKKLLALCLAATCTMGAFASCGDKGDGPEAGATVVSVWLRDFEDWSNNVMKSIMDDFNKDKTDGLHIDYRFITEDAFGDALAAAQDSGNAPDIYQVSYMNLYSEVRNETVLPLNNLLPEASFADLTDSAKSLVTYSGNYYGYPQLMEPSAVMYYRKDLLTAAGVDYSKAEEWSFDDLYAACAKLKTTMKKKNGKYPCLMYDFGQAGWATQGLQANLTGGNVCLTEDWSEIVVNSKAYKDLAAFFVEMYTNEYVPETWTTGYNDQIIDLCDGKAAIVYTGSWGIAEIMETYGADMAKDIGVATIPTLNGGANKGTTATNGGWSLVIDAKSKNPTAAAKIIEYLAAGEDTTAPERYFAAAHYSKSMPRKRMQEKLAQTDISNVCPAEWLTTVLDITDKAIPEAIFTYDINLQTIGLVQGITIDALDGTSMEDSWNSRIGDVITEIEKIMANNNLAGNNPRLAKTGAEK